MLHVSYLLKTSSTLELMGGVAENRQCQTFMIFQNERRNDDNEWITEDSMHSDEYVFKIINGMNQTLKRNMLSSRFFE